MNKILKTGLVLLAMGAMAGCSSLPFGKDKFDDANYATRGSSGKHAQSRAAGVDANVEDRSGSHVNVASKNVFYFKFDNSSVGQKDYETLREHAKYLASHRQAKLRLDGHTDERGSREYNLALGERRANSVAELLKLQGANPQQLVVITHGQEKPVALGHNEDAWRLNRRVEMSYNTY